MIRMVYLIDSIESAAIAMDKRFAASFRRERVRLAPIWACHVLSCTAPAGDNSSYICSPTNMPTAEYTLRSTFSSRTFSARSVQPRLCIHFLLLLYCTWIALLSSMLSKRLTLEIIRAMSCKVKNIDGLIYVCIILSTSLYSDYASTFLGKKLISGLYIRISRDLSRLVF